MKATSDWQELRGLSDEDREAEIDHLRNEIIHILSYSVDVETLEIQQHLDRIKALVESGTK
jgi:ribosomal protein L29